MSTDREEQEVRDKLPQFGNLFEKLFDENDYPNDIELLKSCNYSSTKDFLENNKCYKNKFSVFSHNVRSLSNKWDDFKQILNDFCLEDFNFSVICLQEIWSLNPAFNFTLQRGTPLFTVNLDLKGEKTKWRGEWERMGRRLGGE